MNPDQKQRVGYLVQFEGLNMDDYLKQDIEVFSPYNSAEASYGEIEFDSDSGKVTVVGVIDSFNWAGGVGDAIIISSYISAENAEVLSAKTKTTLDTNIISGLGWWIVNFDEENKAWYEESHPMEPSIVQGQLNSLPESQGGEIKLTVASMPTKVAPNIDLNVYNLYFEVIPAANSTFNFHFATSLKTKYIKNWGLKIGSNAEAAMA